MISPLSALEDCITIEPLTENDIPCYIKNPLPFSTSCELMEVDIYNSIPTLIGEINMTSFGGTGLCNMTFNFTTKGSYHLNISSGDSVRLLVESEDDQMASMAIMLFMMVVTGVIFWLAINKQFTNNPVTILIIRRSLYIVGLLFLLLDFTMLVTISDTFGVGVNQELFRIMWALEWGVYLTLVFLFWNTVRDALDQWKMQKEQKRMG